MKRIINIFMLLVIVFSMYFIPIVKAAETTYTVVYNGSNVRNIPSTTGTKLRSLNMGDEITVYEIIASTYTGDTCETKEWYRIGNGEYMCSWNVLEKYYRPWTSPLKAIVGGAIFISEGYIDKGQYTSYLQKFNVNPSGYYAQYNHQYMTNIRAPYIEAKKSYDGLVSTGIFNLSLVFSIPTFTDMPPITTLSGYTTQDWGQDTITDQSFEDQLNAEGFNETYKRKLRALHTNYPNWVFKAMNTNLDFYTAVDKQKRNGSIDSSAYYDSSMTWVEGSSWYMPSTDATAYFLDPRNSLTIERILMFEKLDYTDIYTESMIASILKNSHMDGYSLIDNRTYASIFLEAGSTARVNPAHLAARALVETGAGATGSVSTRGLEFTYDDITYSGLYNYFNIGAGSGTNTVYKGLVWASGGSPLVIVGGAGSIKNYLKAMGYNVNSNYISKIGVGSTIESFKSSFSGYNISVKDVNGTEIANNGTMKTGYTINLSNSTSSETYNVVIYGDVDGDGDLSSGDILRIRQHLLNSKVSGAFFTAGDLNKSGEIDSGDMLLLRQYLLGQVTSLD